MADGPKVRVRILTNIVGKPSYFAGQIVDLEPRVAKAWIEDELAAPHRDEPVERAVRS